MSGRADLMDRIVKAGPLTIARKQALRAEMRSRGVGLIWRLGNSGRQYLILKGKGGVQTAQFAMTLLDPFIPQALIERGGVRPDGVWEVLIWIDPPVAEYLRREEQGKTLVVGEV